MFVAGGQVPGGVEAKITPLKREGRFGSLIDFGRGKIYPPGNDHISPKNGIFEDDFPNFPRWDMLIPWRVRVKSDVLWGVWIFGFLHGVFCVFCVKINCLSRTAGVSDAFFKDVFVCSKKKNQMFFPLILMENQP